MNFRNNHRWWSIMAHCFRRHACAEICAELHGIIVKWQITPWSCGEESITAHASILRASHSEREMSSNLVRCGSVRGFCSTSLCKWGMTPSWRCVSWGELEEHRLQAWDGGVKRCPCDLLTWSPCGRKTDALLTDTNSAPWAKLFQLPYSPDLRTGIQYVSIMLF